jgi:2-polyprenyl-3-methyl-5-hydroxy-6-metoxy-1,4-benzoquinol methylase
LGYAVLERLNRWLRTGNKRFDFERLYAENADPWEYRTRPYEQRKYALTLSRILEFRSGSARVLEVGCSIGIFTATLAQHFREVVAADISGEALRRAARNCDGKGTVSFHRSALQDLKLEGGCDVIVCAEMLYYVSETYAPAICRRFGTLLRPGGIIVVVGAIVGSCAFWETALARDFRQVFKEAITDEGATYHVMVFRKESAGDAK